MNRRQRSVNREIVIAIDRDDVPTASAFARFLAFWHLFRIGLYRCGSDLLDELRADTWKIDATEYKKSFFQDHQKAKAVLKPIGDLGYSGSTFFATPDSKYLVKSLPRRFEYAFFERDMLHPYYEHMAAYPTSLLVRITDFLVPMHQTLGSVTRLMPTHHLVMENIQYVKDEKTQGKWENYDLKPADYFYPRRDMVPSKMTSKERLKKVVNIFNDKVRLSRKQFTYFKRTIEADTALLEKLNVVDYSLFLNRYPASGRSDGVGSSEQSLGAYSDTNSWRQGVTSVDGKWVYRAVLLDFMFSKHQLSVQATSGAVKTFNIVARQGEMSITTTPADYRRSFLEMIDHIFEIQE